MKANLFEVFLFLEFWVLHAVILASFELLPFSFKLGGSGFENCQWKFKQILIKITNHHNRDKKNTTDK